MAYTNTAQWHEYNRRYVPNGILQGVDCYYEHCVLAGDMVCTVDSWCEILNRLDAALATKWERMGHPSITHRDARVRNANDPWVIAHPNHNTVDQFMLQLCWISRDWGRVGYGWLTQDNEREQHFNKWARWFYRQLPYPEVAT